MGILSWFSSRRTGDDSASLSDASHSPEATSLAPEAASIPEPFGQPAPQQFQLSASSDTNSHLSWQALHYSDAPAETFSPAKSTIPTRGRGALKAIDLLWQPAQHDSETGTSLLLCGNMLLSASETTTLSLTFEQQPLLAALERFNPATLVLESHRAGQAQLLRIALKNSASSKLYLQPLPLKSCATLTVLTPDDPANTAQFESLLNALLESDTSALREYLALAPTLPTALWKQIATTHAYPLAKVMHALLAQGDMDTVEQLATVFMALPRYLSEHFPLVEFVAADLLVIAIERAKPTLYQRIRQQLLVQKPITDYADPRLLFNFACYAARTKDKAEMLACTRQALSLGKAKSDFEQDSDFAAYLQDPEFQKLLQAG